MQLTASDLKQLVCGNQKPFDNGMIGRYVVVRCYAAGVHAGVLEATNGQECVLSEARRLWYWKTNGGSAFLCGVAVDGLDSSISKVGKPVERRHLTEDCEITLCTKKAEASIRSQENHNEQAGR